MDDVSVSEDRIHYLLTGLKPHTQYAIYVKTFTIATYRYGAKSDILYFKTLPDRKCFCYDCKKTKLIFSLSFQDLLRLPH